LHDVFCDHRFCYMVMEKCQAGLLQALESMPELTERGLGNVFAQMLLGIAHCHNVKVCHRDIKPDNFLVAGADGQVVKLADFGLSAQMPKQGKLPGVFGTAPFMCPEMLLGKWYDEKADVWSFAVIVYALMFGLFPYMPKQQSSKAMKQAIIDGTTPPNFEPVQRVTSGNALMRSDAALSCIRPLLDRDPEVRPTAEETLHSPWMSAALQGNHMPGADLPSLRPMLHSAKKVGAFEVRDVARDTAVDVQLNELQMQRLGIPLPVPNSMGTVQPAEQRRPITPSASQTSASSGSRSLGIKPKSGKEAWDDSSGRSTATGSSSSGMGMGSS